MYVPKNYPVVERGDGLNKGQSSTPRRPEECFTYIFQVASNLIPLMEVGYIGIDLSKQEKRLTQLGLGEHLNLFNDKVREGFFSGKYHPMLFSILQGLANQMAYVKLYDVNLPDSHPDNYYMEREWRSLKNVLFSICDIKTIYLPSEEHKSRFMEIFPEFQRDFFIFD